MERKKLKVLESKGLAESAKAGRSAVVAVGCSQDLSPGHGRACKDTRSAVETQGIVTPPKCPLRAYFAPSTALGAEQTKVEYFIKTAKTFHTIFLHRNPCEGGWSDPFYR